MTAKKTLENMSFEDALGELEAIVTQMEQGDVPLEDALKQFERGVSLARQGQQRLAQAEQKVKILMQQQGQDFLADFDDLNSQDD